MRFHVVSTWNTRGVFVGLLANQSLVNFAPLIDATWQHDVKSTFFINLNKIIQNRRQQQILKSWIIGIQATLFCSVANHSNFIILHGKVRQSRLQNTWRKSKTSQKSVKKMTVIGEHIRFSFSASTKITPPLWVFINISYKTYFENFRNEWIIISLSVSQLSVMQDEIPSLQNLAFHEK